MGGILIGDKHTEKDWDLIWVDLVIPPPSLKTHTVSVPGMNGIIDLTERMGGVKFNDRQLEFRFVLHDKDIGLWHRTYAEIANFCHGQIKDIILDSDNQFYWRGRVIVESTKEDQIHSTITIVVDAEPFKYDLISSADDWLWDPFNFRTGVIRNYKNMTVTGTTALDIIGTEKDIVPTIICSRAMTLVFEGKTYQLAMGENINRDIVLRAGSNQMRFTTSGTGTVTILFRGASL